MNLAEHGVELWREVLPQALLEPVIAEYEASEPESTEVPKHVPVVVYRTHVAGEMRRIQLLSKMPQMLKLAEYVADLIRIGGLTKKQLRLLETVIFNKPPETSGVLHWHQDVSYFALEPNNQLAVWIPFDKVTKDSGAMQYALGSHKLGLRASHDLHTDIPLDPADTRPKIDVTGMEVRCMEMDPGDMLIHDGYTWHMSGANKVQGQRRRGLSLRFLVGETRYAPRAGSAAPFLKQINDLAPGDLIDDPAFPVL